MSIKSQYNFAESKLGADFAKEKMAEFKKMIEASQSFTVVSMPGVGVSYFLKYLSTRDFALFVHVDLYNLSTLNQHEFYRMFLRDLAGNPDGKSDEQVFLETKEILKKLAVEHKTVVIIFSRFDQLKEDLDENFLSNLQSLTILAPNRIVLIFTSTKPLHEIAPEAIRGGNLIFYSKSLYFKPYSKNDLKKLLTIDPEQRIPDENFEKILDLSGGHNQLLHILLNCRKQNFLLDHFVRLQLKELVDYLDYAQRKQIIKVALDKKIEEVDEYLLGVGMVKQKGTSFELFTPLLADYIKANMPIKLPPRESKLFKLLRNNINRIISKDEIFNEVWGQESDKVTDWALDALIYRLRKHPFITSQGYIIESHKKVGYSLIQT